MVQWITENWLAAYGALVGTVALGLNLIRFLHARKRDTVQLEVTGQPHESYEGQIQRLREGIDKPAYERSGLLEVYKVQITNIGNIPVHLEDAGVITKDGQSISVLTRNFNGKDPNILGPLASSNAPPIDPKSSQTYWVWLKIDQEPFEVASYFAIDKTGKKWSANT